MTLASAAHKIPLEVAHTLVEIAEVARYAYHHRPGQLPGHDGDASTLVSGDDGGGSDGEEAARLREENAMLRARLADDLVLLRELHGAPSVSKECPPDLYNRLLAAVNNASFLAHLEKLQVESERQHTELSSGNMTEVEVGDVPDKMGNGKKGSWVLVACDTAGTNLEEISGIDDENYVIVNEDDIVDGIASFVARCILEDPKSKSLSPAQLQKGMLYKSRHVLKVAAKGAAVSARFVMKALCCKLQTSNGMIAAMSANPTCKYRSTCCAIFANPSRRDAAFPNHDDSASAAAAAAVNPMGTKPHKNKQRSTPNASVNPMAPSSDKKPKLPKPAEEQLAQASASDKKPKKKKARDEIDEIFSAAKAAKKRNPPQREEAEAHGAKRKKPKERDDAGSSKKKSNKTPGSKGKGRVADDDEEEEEVEEKRPRRRTADGLAIYSAAELGFGKADAGGTPLCPFDCD
ncbi:hypothetical protein U9M48_010261, partial [Paspalum notatum var. saurae]